MSRFTLALLVMTSLVAVGRAQTPRPFPGATAQPARPATPPPSAPPPSSIPADPRTPSTQAPPQAPRGSNVAAPSEATLGVQLYPGAQFIGSYDAGSGQRYYLFGTTATFVEVAGFYRTQIGEKGDEVYKDPPTQMFTGGTLPKFKDETMAFPPSVTVKDWTTGGSGGYPNPKPGTQPTRFPTVVMIVPAPPGTPAR